MKSTFVAVVKATVTAVLFYLLFRSVNFTEFVATLRHARYDILLAGFLVLWLGHYICIFRWRMLMRPLMPIPSLTNLFGIYCIGLFFNLAFPTVVGGDVVKMYYAGKPSRRFAQSFAATFLDRDTGMLAMMIIAVVATLFHPVRLAGIPVPLIIWSAFVLFVAVNVAIFAPRFHQAFVRGLQKLRLERIAAKVDMISLAFQTIGRHWNVLALSLLISVVNQMLVISVTWLTAVALRIEVSFLYFLVFVPVITLISMIPISLNGMGLREYAFVTLFTAIGVDRESGVALGLLSSAIILLSALPGGVVYVFFRSRADVEQMTRLETGFT
ncbi:MAG: flippase-like domain-containing protein [Acidobacteria bacterium]|nr:flippase-like domain-containing protein [Acidobacteriota bacterium]